jgi:hypothetical protein
MIRAKLLQDDPSNIRTPVTLRMCVRRYAAESGLRLQRFSKPLAYISAGVGVGHLLLNTKGIALCPVSLGTSKNRVLLTSTFAKCLQK